MKGLGNPNATVDAGKILGEKTTQSAQVSIFSLKSISPLTLTEADYSARWNITLTQKVLIISPFLKTSLFNSIYYGFLIFHRLNQDWVIYVFIQVKSNKIYLIKHRLQSESSVQREDGNLCQRQELHGFWIAFTKESKIAWCFIVM